MSQPPPAVPVSSRVRKGFQALAANVQKMETIRQNAEVSKYFDGSAPSTRKRREQARAQFQEFVESCYGLTEMNDVWSRDTFLDYTKQFLEGITNISVGKLEKKIKAQTLWGYKYAIYWWAVVLVKDFNSIWQQWHEEVNRHIQLLAVQESLSTRSWAKNNLSDGELVLIFRHICEQRYGVANLKQHWAAMLLTWLTGARPGSFTVAAGYQQGASLGLPGRVRETSQTLRWSDVDFVNMKNGIAVRITLRYNKGFRNPNKEGSSAADGRRTFVFLPSIAERLEFDMPLILLGIAYERGLFVQTLEDILSQTPHNVFIKKEPNVDKQAVFVAASQAGHLDPTKPMNIHALNPKLQQLCTGIGLFERNTYYSFRRSAIIEVRRQHTTESAKDFAHHKLNSNSLFFYDNVGFGDIDMQQYRLGGAESMSREEVRKYFSQVNITRLQPKQGDEDLTLREVLDEKVKEQLSTQDDYIAHELKLKDLYEEMGNKLEELQTAGVIPSTEKIPSGFAARAGARYQSLSVTYGLDELVKKVNAHMVNRKQLHRAIRLRLRKEIHAEMRKEHRAVIAESMAQSARKLAPGGTFEPQQVKGVKVTGIGQSEEEERLFVDAGADTASFDDDNNDGVNEEALQDGHDINSREEPECWEGLEDEVHVQLGGGKPTAETEETRYEFLMMWIKLSDLVVAQSNLLCPRCKIDPTMDKSAKERRFNLFRLNTHMRGSTHTREAQLRRALKLDGMDNTSMITCPTCTAMVKGVKKFMKHVKSAHKETLWEDFDDSGSSQPVTDVTDFEGLSDPMEPLEEQSTDFEGFSPPSRAYTGKGKGKA
ncbi:hypothetical protein BKA66DRAFT_579444 [Pyrenochaeta sp. MPI-SDFR-AT-0127]|nr:hypothetical protein BKA66DRAFT_579444 [Pyrenochaeta sp. MPI-SDFR-AT-0127]